MDNKTRQSYSSVKKLHPCVSDKFQLFGVETEECVYDGELGGNFPGGRLSRNCLQQVFLNLSVKQLEAAAAGNRIAD